MGVDQFNAKYPTERHARRRSNRVLTVVAEYCGMREDQRVATTSLWVTLAGSCAGAVVALAGVIISQVLTERRETARWAREQSRQRETWEREDAARTYEQRRDAYLAYANEWHRYHDKINEHFDRRSRGYALDPDEDALNDLYKYLLQVEIFGTDGGRKAAKTAFKELADWLFGDRKLDYAVIESYQEQVRDDLAIPPSRVGAVPRPHVQQRSTATDRTEPDHEGPQQPA
jgi:hypothetical protein